MNSKSFTDVVARVSAMSAAEIADRLRQEAAKRADLIRHQFTKNAESRKGPGAGVPTGKFFFDKADVPQIVTVLRQRFPDQATAIIADAERICTHRFRLLGYKDIQYGPSIDWHLDALHQRTAPRKPWFKINYFDSDQVGDPKITWELNRHQHLVILAKAFRLTGDRKFAVELFSQWRSWQETNPYLIGINWASSLEVSFRSLSWLWVWFLLQDTDVMPPDFGSELSAALTVAGSHIERYLSTYTSPNTHLLGEAVGLFFIGTLCPQLASAARWKNKGWQIVLNEARNQVRRDGLHFEQSTYYHVYALDFFLHARMLAQRNAVAIPAWFDDTVQKMLEALRLLGQAGAPPSFGDDDGGRVFDSNRNRREHLLDPLSTGAVLFGRSDFKHAARMLTEETLWLLGPAATDRFDRIAPRDCLMRSASLPDGGAYIMTNASGEQLVIDAGPQGTHTAGHGHADALSIHLSAHGRELLSDPGTFAYSGDGRRWFRSTAAHNTLQVDGLDQADPKTPFSWNRLTTTNVDRWIVAREFDVFQGNHNGYERLEHPVTHKRWVINFKQGVWLVRDVARGSGVHELSLAWHLPPDTPELAIRPAEQPGWSEEIRQEWWSPAYGEKLPSSTVIHHFKGQLPAELATALASGSAEGFGDFRRIDSRPDLAAYEYRTHDAAYLAVFSQGQRTWSVGDWASDAALLCCVVRRGQLESLLFCDGTHVNQHNQPLAVADRRISWCELIRHGSTFEISSPEREAVRLEVLAATTQTAVTAESGRTVS